MISWLRNCFSRVPHASPRSARSVLDVEVLEGRVVPAGVLAVGTGAGYAPFVLLYHDSNNDGVPDAAPYAGFPVLRPYFTGGVQVAVGHFTSNTTLDVVVAAGPGGPPLIQVFHLNASDVPTGNPETFFPPIAHSFTGGLNIARYHSGGATFDSLAVSLGAGSTPSVFLYNDGTTLNGAVPNDGKLGNSQIDSFLAYAQTFHAGVRIAAGRNLTGGAISDFLVTAPGPGHTPKVNIIRDNNNNLLLSDDLASREIIFPFAKTWMGGVNVGVGDVGSPSANAELIFGKDAGGVPAVAIFTDANNNNKFGDDGGPVSTFLAYPASFRGGVRVAASRLSPAAVNLQGEFIVAPGAGSPEPVEVFKAANNGEVGPSDSPIASFFPFGPSYLNGFSVAFGGNGS
jgi:hypothetical protein